MRSSRCTDRRDTFRLRPGRKAGQCGGVILTQPTKAEPDCSMHLRCNISLLWSYLYTASVSRQIKSEDHQSEDGLFDEENEAVCSFIAEALL